MIAKGAGMCPVALRFSGYPAQLGRLPLLNTVSIYSNGKAIISQPEIVALPKSCAARALRQSDAFQAWGLAL